MSGIETLGLANNILQVISTACQTIALCQAVYHGRSPDETLKECAENLASLSVNARKQCQQIQPASKNDKVLLDIAGKCYVAAHALADEFQFLASPQATGHLLATPQVAAKTQWRKRRLARLEKSLKNDKKLVETHLWIWSVMSSAIPLLSPMKPT